MKQQALLIIKPNAVRRKLVGLIIHRLERVDLTIDHIQHFTFTSEALDVFCSHIIEKSFYPSYKQRILSGPCVFILVSADHTVSLYDLLIKITGATDPLLAQPGSIRGDFAYSIEDNIIHRSDTAESFVREYSIIKMLLK